jgi:endoglucanase
MLALFLLSRVLAAGIGDMPSDAVAISKNLGLGWNLGNTLEACNDQGGADETWWGNPKTTKAFIDVVKAAGFRTVRIPCAWTGYIDDPDTFHIKDSWLARVREVVGYIIDNDMYAILNTHWDGGWLEEHPRKADQEAVIAKETAIWTQIANYFKDVDEHLLFAGTNEVRDGYGTPTDENLEVQQSYLQTFVDAVRATGGNNEFRNLVVQGYRTEPDLTIEHLKIPKDSISGRLLVEVHYYAPWEFTIQGENVWLWGTKYAGEEHAASWGQEDYVDETFDKLQSTFGSKGYPVIIGEYGVSYRLSLEAEDFAKHDDARNHYLNYVTKAAITRGITPVYWDNGDIKDTGSGLFDRAELKVAYPVTLKAIISAGREARKY